MPKGPPDRKVKLWIAYLAGVAGALQDWDKFDTHEKVAAAVGATDRVHRDELRSRAAAIAEVERAIVATPGYAGPA